MAIYPVLLIAGLLGLVGMAALGFAHGSHAGARGGHTGARGPGAHASGGGHSAGAGSHSAGARGPVAARAVPGARAVSPGAAARASSGRAAAAGSDAQVTAAPAPGQFATGVMWLMPLMSPLTWFGWLVGAGAAGSLCQLARVGEPLRAGIAVGGAVAFNMAVLKPIWNLVFGFATTPAANLEGCLLQNVEAVTAFDARGEGLIRIVVDGRTEDVLARLTPEARARGERVRKGDQLMVEEVDPHTNRCSVSRYELI